MPRSPLVLQISDSARLIARSKQQLKENRALTQSLEEHRAELHVTREENRRLRDDLRYLRVVARCTDAVVSKLTERERTVWKMLAQGLNTAEIAGILRISPRKAIADRLRLLAKLDIHNLATLTRLAVRRKLVAP
jgi:DNA-binding CsgD family transcriptional regulator